MVDPPNSNAVGVSTIANAPEDGANGVLNLEDIPQAPVPAGPPNNDANVEVCSLSIFLLINIVKPS